MSTPNVREAVLRIRTARKGDVLPLIDFLDANGSPSLPIPSVPALEHALAKQATYVAEVEGRIVACAGLFHVCEGVDGSGARTVVSELAATRVTGRVGGLAPFRIQDVFLSMRIVAPFVANQPGADPGRKACVMAAVLPSGAASAAALSRNGLVAIDPQPRWLSLEQRSWAPGTVVGYSYVPPAAAAAHALRLLGMTEPDFALHRTSDVDGATERFRIDWMVRWLTYGRPVIVALGEGAPTGLALGPVPTRRRLSGGGLL